MGIGTGGGKRTNKIQSRFFFAVHVWLFALDFLAALMNFVLPASKGRNITCRIKFYEKVIFLIHKTTYDS